MCSSLAVARAGAVVCGLIMMACAVTTVWAARVGDTYAQVMGEKGKPKSEMEAGSLRVLNYADAVIKLRNGVVVSIKPVAAALTLPISTPANSAPAPVPAMGTSALMAKTKADMEAAVKKVVLIVNQPVPSEPRPPEKQLMIWHFHDGATLPDFNNVDIRKTQERKYGDYITWEGNSDLMWHGEDCEFNPMTKYFYTDRSLPKKRLSESEMIEVNRLYRVIGRCEVLLEQMGYTGGGPQMQ